jgi:hypothetical protein
MVFYNYPNEVLKLFPHLFMAAIEIEDTYTHTRNQIIRLLEESNTIEKFFILYEIFYKVGPKPFEPVECLNQINSEFLDLFAGFIVLTNPKERNGLEKFFILSHSCSKKGISGITG